MSSPSDTKHPVARLIGYLSAVSTNLVIDEARKRARRPETISLDAPCEEGESAGRTFVETLIDPESDISRQVLLLDHQAALRILVRQAVECMSPQQQAILQLDVASEWEMSDQEIALLLGTTPGNVRNQRSRARARLREIFQARRASDPEVEQTLSELLVGRQSA